MQLKVYDKSGKAATEAQVKAALPKDVVALTVADRTDFILVNFPQGANKADWGKVQKHLQSQGFETE